MDKRHRTKVGRHFTRRLRGERTRGGRPRRPRVIRPDAPPQTLRPFLFSRRPSSTEFTSRTRRTRRLQTRQEERSRLRFTCAEYKQRLSGGIGNTELHFRVPIQNLEPSGARCALCFQLRPVPALPVRTNPTLLPLLISAFVLFPLQEPAAQPGQDRCSSKAEPRPECSRLFGGASLSASCQEDVSRGCCPAAASSSSSPAALAPPLAATRGH